jgi:hypothetical protein
MADDVLILNQPLQSRTNKSGKQRYTINVRSEPLIHNLDPLSLGHAPAEAIADALRRKVLAIAEPAAANTLRSRATALAAFTRGAPWTQKRYGGGRMGSMPPHRSDAAFNDSGRFAGGIVARHNPKEHAWTINVPANRLDDDTSGGAVRIWRQLVRLVPEFGDPALLLNDAKVAGSLGVHGLITKANETREMLLEQRAQMMTSVAKLALGSF